MTFFNNKLRGISIDERKSIGVDIGELNNLNNELPKAYIEFLEYCGIVAPMLLDMEYKFDEIEDIQKRALGNIEIEGFSIDRPYWIFAIYEEGEQFHFFYLDEQNENPSVYICDAGYWEDGEVDANYSFIRKVSSSFTEFIIELTKERQRHGY